MLEITTHAQVDPPLVTSNLGRLYVRIGSGLLTGTPQEMERFARSLLAEVRRYTVSLDDFTPTTERHELHDLGLDGDCEGCGYPLDRDQLCHNGNCERFYARQPIAFARSAIAASTVASP